MERMSSALMSAVLLVARAGACPRRGWNRNWTGGTRGSTGARQRCRAARRPRPGGRRDAQARLGPSTSGSRTLEERTWPVEDRHQGAEARADAAAARAEGATARAEGVDARLTRLWASRNARTVVNVLQVEFGFDQSALDDAAKSMLFVLVGELRGNPELALDLEGYTDSRGSRQYNVRLSQRRIDAVRRYLIEQGVERHRIRASARGPLDDGAVPEERKRRVDIKLVVAAD